MKRREFVKKGSVLTTGIGLGSAAGATMVDSQQPSKPGDKDDKVLNAYYFCAHTYTMVPGHIREDLKWMAGMGTDVVSLSILEQDFFAAVENVEIVCNEAARLGMKIFAVPSRWGGLFAGAPKVPSIFSATHPGSWVLEADGTPYRSAYSGVKSSIYYPEVYDFVCASIDQVFGLWDIAGIIWDEPKSYSLDYSPKAREVLGEDPSRSKHLDHVVDFHGRISRHVKEQFPDKVTCLFNHASSDDLVVQKSAATGWLDYFGADGRPWGPEDGGKLEAAGKTLLGPGERHLEAAHQNGKKSLWLMENHNMRTEDIRLMKRRMPEILEKPVDHLIYYYYPRNLEDPDRNMEAVANALKEFR